MRSIEPAARLTAYGNQLIEIHIWLREQLERLRAEVDDHLDGAGGRPRELRAYCLTFCSALTLHHTGEDAGAFIALAERVPELRPVLAELTRDHALVAATLTRVTELVDTLPVDPDAATALRVRTELETLSALLETHFTYEERKLTAALDALPRPAGPTERLFGINPPPR